MSSDSQECPQCSCDNGYFDGSLWVCPECFHEWNIDKVDASFDTLKFLDINGVQLVDGDSVRTIKDLKVGKETIKSGTKVKNIKLLDEPVNEHDISCKVPGFGHMYLKCSVVKKEK